MTVKTRHGATVQIDANMLPVFETHTWKVDLRGYLTRSKYDHMRPGRVCVYKKLYFHRLVMDAQPGQEVDHINRDKTDNRRANLRFVTRSVNVFNQGARRSSTTRVTGVSWFKPAQLFRAYIGGGRSVRCDLGYFRSPWDAIEARMRAEEDWLCAS